ncbi:zinc/cadmium resistance protein [Athalia rosae]|uniref:zinc/cadmium resistance protein n=1 Tax=Athalia rosae TaxID=37344 RepID=UPI002033837E|nr:zinc/cadmium resistance protein [Athalia rosae]XP_012264990.2 zinc/cadmium resistance protein [Athalia rosae]XP_020711044.2 zinc/cadmium resistance protein [Athalia rosae]XP_048512133.1 zinc/cadmium resistance protein [Athalia rosae]XP_048512134.1 zinc/cadmium resistance protein [Athalia rosae]
MAVKEWFRRLQPMQLYLVLFLTSAFFAVELITSHLTHALTLLVNAYHMLCNIIALIGCIASIKYSSREDYPEERNHSFGDLAICDASHVNSGSVPSLSIKIKQSRSDRRMKNTFGWARINILTMLVCCVFLASFCFSLQVEALQTLVHIDHADAMHHPLAVLCIGAAGILLNAFCYIFIGGYTFYHGSSLQVTPDGDVIIKRNISTNSVVAGEEQLQATRTRNANSLRLSGRQGIREMCRDVLGCIFVIVVSVLVHYTDSDIGKFIDPVIAIISSTSLFVLSYPYMKESGLILLQTIPNHINIDSLKKELLEAFPGVVNVHDLHVWQLTGDKVISTAHIIFLDPTVYASIRHLVTAFFVQMGITQVTIQPEFQKLKPEVKQIDCLIRCQGENCSLGQCCSKDVLSDPDPTTEGKEQRRHSHTINRKFEHKEIIPASPPISLKRFTLHASEYSENSSSRETLPEDMKILKVDTNTANCGSAIERSETPTRSTKVPKVMVEQENKNEGVV